MTGRSRIVAGLLACGIGALVVGVALGPSVAGTQSDVVVRDVSVSGDAVAARSDRSVYLWSSRPYALTATVDGIPTAARYRVCALSETEKLSCETTTLRPNRSNVELGVAESDAFGVRNVSVAMARIGANETIVASRLVRLHVLRPNGDADDDGLRNRAERRRGTNPAEADTDGDALGDGTEVVLGSDPLNRTTTAVLGLVALLVAALVGVVAREVLRLAGSVRGSGGDRSGASGTDPGGAAPADDATAESDGTDEYGVDGTDGGNRAAARAGATPSTLSDEEHVLRMLEEGGGQLPQSEIVERTPWSKSKVSRLLARMDAQGLVVKINAGRRNVIALPGEEPDAVQSPGEGEDA